MSSSTNWDQYYRSAVGLARLTRWLSSRRILRLLKRFRGASQPLTICELGGANSCFLLPLCNGLSVKNYHVVDTCSYGLGLLSTKQQLSNVPLTWEVDDVLAAKKTQIVIFDLVFSVGLIEHFDMAGTQQAIANHFARVRPGGLVMITFPTPTLIYRVLRYIAEQLGQWKFPDERPLLQNEVSDHCRLYGEILHESLHYGAVFTQAYILVRAKG